MQRQPWLKDLHESPQVLRYTAQVAATLLLHSHATLYLSSVAALDLVTQCEWMGDRHAAAAVLTCVARATDVQVPEAPPTGGPSAHPHAQSGSRPSTLKWVSGGVYDLNDAVAAGVPSPAASPPLSIDPHDTAQAELNIYEAYYTCTPEAVIGSSAPTASAVNVLGGSVGIAGGVASQENSGLRKESDAAPASSSSPPSPFHETIHVLVVTALGGAASERAENAVRPLPSDVLPPLLQFLDAAIAPSKSEFDGESQLQLHLSVNGWDVMAAARASAEHHVEEYDPNMFYDSYSVQQPRKPVCGASTPLTSCTVDEAYAKLTSATLNNRALQDEGEDEAVISHVLRQCEATLRQVQCEAHRQRLMWVRQQALRSRQQQKSPGPADAPPPSARAAILLCVDEYHLAQWASSGHPLVSPTRVDGPVGLPLQWALYMGVPIYICLMPSSTVSPPRLLARLSEAPFILKGVLAAQQLCTRTRGFFCTGEDQDLGPRTAMEVARNCDVMMDTIVARLHAWVSAVYRDMYWCVFSELPRDEEVLGVKRSSDGEKRTRSAGASSQVPSSDALPHCEVCAPAAAAQAHNAAVYVRLWCCHGTLLSPSMPRAAFLAYETIPASKALGSRIKHGSNVESLPAASQPLDEEPAVHYAFAFAHTRHGCSNGVFCAASRVVRVRPRSTPFKSGPRRQWYHQQLQWHDASVTLAAVLEAQVEQAKAIFFFLATAEGGHDARRSVISARECEAQTEAVTKALQQLATLVAQLKETEQALLITLRHLLPLESLEEDRAVSLSPALSSASPLHVSQRGIEPFPRPIMDAFREVEAARRTMLREQQRKEHPPGDPSASSPTDSASTVRRLLSLTFLLARMAEMHALYAINGGNHLMRQTQTALAGRSNGHDSSEEQQAMEATAAAARPIVCCEMAKEEPSVSLCACQLYSGTEDVVDSRSAAATQLYKCRTEDPLQQAQNSLHPCPTHPFLSSENVSSADPQATTAVRSPRNALSTHEETRPNAAPAPPPSTQSVAAIEAEEGIAMIVEEPRSKFDVVLPLAQPHVQHSPPLRQYESMQEFHATPVSRCRCSAVLPSGEIDYRKAFIRLQSEESGQQQQHRKMCVNGEPFNVRLPPSKPIDDYPGSMVDHGVLPPAAALFFSSLETNLARASLGVGIPAMQNVTGCDATEINAAVGAYVMGDDDAARWPYLRVGGRYEGGGEAQQDCNAGTEELKHRRGSTATTLEGNEHPSRECSVVLPTLASAVRAEWPDDGATTHGHSAPRLPVAPQHPTPPPSPTAPESIPARVQPVQEQKPSDAADIQDRAPYDTSSREYASTPSSPRSRSDSTTHTHPGFEEEREEGKETNAEANETCRAASTQLRASKPETPSSTHASGTTALSQRCALDVRPEKIRTTQNPKEAPEQVQPRVPAPTRDLRWCAVPTKTAAPSTSLPALLTSRLPSSVTSSTPMLHAARYASGILTVDVLDPTTTCVAALCADTPEKQQQMTMAKPAAHLALFSIDAATGILRFIESQACAIAPGSGTKSFGRPSESSPSLEDNRVRSRYSFRARLTPGEAVATIYVGLRHALSKAVIPADVLWLSGIAFSVESPEVRQARVTSVQSNGFVIEWHTAPSSPAHTSVKLLVTELATPSAETLSAANVQPSTERNMDAQGAAAPIALQDRHATVHVGQTSPTTITGLRSASIYHVQLIPISNSQRAVKVVAPASSPSSQQQQQLLLDCIVDEGVSARAVIAATGVAPAPSFMHVEQVMVAQPAALTEAPAGDAPHGCSSCDSACPLVTGTVVSPLLYYRTSVFPTSLLRHCSLVDQQPDGTDIIGAAPQQRATSAAVESGGVPAAPVSAQPLMRLHYTLISMLSKNTTEIRSAADTTTAACNSVNNFQITSANTSSCTCSHVFRMVAGKELRVALSLCIQLDAELIMHTTTAPHASSSPSPTLRYVSVLEALQRRVLQAVLGPFHVCGPGVDVRQVGSSEAELTWEGTCPVYDVSVMKMETASFPLVQSSEANRASKGYRDVDAPGVEKRAQAFQVRGKPLKEVCTAHIGPAAGRPVSSSRFRASLKLAGLHPASEYEIHVRGAANHIGGTLKRVWHTRPVPPPLSTFIPSFHSAARQLYLRFLQHRACQEPHNVAGAPTTAYEVIVEPLGTSIEVPVVAASTACDIVEGACGDGGVNRVVDCSAVAPGTPITISLRHRVTWHSIMEQRGDGCCFAGQRAPDTPASSTTATSTAVVYGVVSDFRVRAVHAPDPTSASTAVLELTWTCSDVGDRQTVAYVEFNGAYRVHLDGRDRNQLRLTMLQLREAAAAAAARRTTRHAQLMCKMLCEDNTKALDRMALPYYWRGVLCVTGFGGLEEAGASSSSPRTLCVVPDRCQLLILPPPPTVPPSAVWLINYQDEACVDVDVGVLYCLYFETLAGYEGNGQQPSVSAHPTRHLADALQQRIYLALEVRKTDVAEMEDSAVQRYPLLPPASQQHHKRPYQRIRIPLPSYRPYDGQLYLALHVSVSDALSESSDAEEAAARPLCGFLPIPSSPSALAFPIPPAEPITDITVSAITAHDAVVDWAPPLSLLRHLRQQPRMSVSYEVQLYSAVAASSPSSTAMSLTTPSLVRVSAEPHVALTSLQPATPYVVYVRGTGLGSYYAAVRFITAPVVADVVMAQLRSSLAVEAVVRSGVSVNAGARDGEQRKAPASPERGSRGGKLRKRLALWAVLPASTVVQWSLMSHLPSDAGEAAVKASGSAADDAHIVKVTTHYTVSLITCNGELLCQWSSSPGTPTMLYHEWNAAACDTAASGVPSLWPHLEVMACSPSASPLPQAVKSQSDAAVSGAPRGVFFVTPRPNQSGVYCRTRLDLVGLPRLTAPGAGKARVISWEGSSPYGFCVSWCLSTALHDVRHTMVPATSPPPYAFSLPAALITETLAEHRHNRFTKDEVAHGGPVLVLVCVSSGSSEMFKRRQRRGGHGHVSPLSSDGVPSWSTSLAGIRDGGSNTLCMAWLLPSAVTQVVQPEAAVVYQSSTKVTLLLPQDHPIRGAQVKEEEVNTAMSSPSSQCSRAIRALLQRKWSVAPPSVPNRASESLYIQPWTAAQYPETAYLANGMSLTDVQMPSGSAAVDDAVVELICVDTVSDKLSVVWQQLVAHVMQEHKRAFSAFQPPLANSAALPSLRWLRSPPETVCEQRIRAVCTLRQLTLSSIEEGGVVRVPPLATADRARASLPDSKGEAGAEGPRSAHNQRPTERWLPLRTAGAVVGTVLAMLVGERHDGEDNIEQRDGDAAAAATLAELKALQSWSQRGHPTLRARLTWVSDDDEFVLRVAGPYEACGRAVGGSKGRAAEGQRGDRHKIEADPTVLGGVSDPLRLQRHVHSILSPDVFPSLKEMRHQRTYTCVPVSAKTKARHEAGVGAGSGAYLSLQPDGSVAAVAAATNTAATVSDDEALQSCVLYVVEVDGLIPESFYRVQVTGKHSGDAALRMQLVTPPSGLTQVVAIGESPWAGCPVQREGEGVCLSPLQPISVHARIYNPHMFTVTQEDSSGEATAGQGRGQQRGSLLVPGIRYQSYAAIEVWSVKSGQRLSDHRTYSNIKSSVRQSEVDSSLPTEAEEEMLPITASAFTLKVEEAVQVYAVRHLDLLFAPSEEYKVFMNAAIWGPLITPPLLSSAAQPSGETAALCPSGPRQLHARLLLCNIPQLPRMRNLSLLRRTPHSMQLSWRWWSGAGIQEDLPSTDEAAPTLLCVRCCRVSPGKPVNRAERRAQQHTEGCTILVPVTRNPTVTLAPLHPGALYLIGIQEVRREQAAGVRAVVPSLSSFTPTSLFSRSPSRSHSRPLGGELYAFRPSSLPPDASAALRALARVSARPVTLVLPLARQQQKHMATASPTRIDVPRGAVMFHALTPPLPLALPPPLTDCTRRRPGSMSILLPSHYAHTRLYDVDGGDKVEGAMRVLSYVAVVAVPEGIVYVPKDAAAAVHAWWADTHHSSDNANSTSSSTRMAAAQCDVWEWWADRMQTTMERDWLSQNVAHQPRQRRAGAAEMAVQEHWNQALARRLAKSSAEEGDRSSWRLRVQPIEVQKRSDDAERREGGEASPEEFRFVVPIKEPTPFGVSGPDNADKAPSMPMSKAVYLVQCVEVLPSGPYAVAHGGNGGVVGGAQQLMVGHAPLSVKKLQLLHEITVRGTVPTAPLSKGASAELHVQWKWPLWATQASAAVTGIDDTAESALAIVKPQPPCAASITCTPQREVPSTAAASPTTAVLNDAGRSSETSAVGIADAGAVFIHHVASGQREVNIAGLSPSTLYRIAFGNVCYGKGSSAIRCAEKTVTALTPPAPPAPGSLPQLHYTILPSTAPIGAAIADSSAHHRPSSPPAGVEVRFDLPAARWTAQGLLLCPHALLVNLDAVDVAACRTVEDFIAAAEAERLAPHVRSKPRGSHGSEVEWRLSKTADREAPVLYRNTSAQKQLRTCITLLQPLQQRYALVFFHAVLVGWEERGGTDGETTEAEVEARPRKASAGSAAGPSNAFPAEKVVYSAPSVKVMHYPPSVCAAYNADSLTSADLQEVLVNRWRRLLCRPTRLIVQQRTPTCLTLRWQLDLSVARLSDLERLKLLRHGVFTIRILPDSDLREAASDAPALSDTSGQQESATATPGSRTVFYRSNVPPAPPKPPRASDGVLTSAEPKHVDARVAQAEVLCLPVSDYRASADGTVEEEAEAAAAASVSALQKNSGSGSSEVLTSVPEEREQGGEVGATTHSSHACLTYELNYPFNTYVAAHTGYTVEVLLSPDWNHTERTKSKSPSLPSSSTAAEHMALTISIPPITLPQPVQRVSVTRLTQTSCSLKWIVAEDERPAAYVVRYTRHQIRCDCEAADCVLEPEEYHQVWVSNAQQTAVTLEKLHPHACYTICIVPCNVYGEACEKNNATVTVHTH
ncbi:hypothetical protein ABL78_4903 [Leptomonas seymouri]|uniref:Fibronectin type-III domain-containing protein n=1 Tax=Leptomonas seymouri TaxID=5684 RepID=A0A0N1I2X1_LEPSE|nr:hypothetical protein ABL78_4903 [Leptomonas seymouri]|eukprot:KPI86034.1 hypothetical protein ABL78_4903 [Leptomonas seymouri]